MIVVVDYGAANLLSITRALEAAGASVTISGDPRSIAATEGVVLPGVGAASSAMDTLRASGADRALRDTAARGRPLLGVCLGMQLFFERLTAPDWGCCTAPLRCSRPGKKFPTWAGTACHGPQHPGTDLFAGLEPGTCIYFVHSCHCVPGDDSSTIARTEYGEPICAASAQGRICGVRFHPEKSGAAGRRMLAN